MSVSLFTLERSPATGKRTLLLITLGVLLLSLTWSALETWVSGVGEPMWWPPSVVAALLVLAALRQVPLDVTVLLGVLAFLPAALMDVLHALVLGTLPAGLGLWTPVVLAEVFVLLEARLGLIVAGLIGGVLLFGLLVHLPGSAALRGAWLNLMLAWLLLAGLGYAVSRVLERAQAQRDLQQRALAEARQDALTRLLGRAALEAELEEAVKRAEAQHTPLSLVICDLDDFKRVNDQYGHAKGDEVLRVVARRLKRGVVGGVVGRWGGEEFLLVLPLSKPDARARAEQLRRDIEEREVAGLRLTVSLGVASYRIGEGSTSLFARADQRLYEAKRAGRNTVR